MSINEAAVVQIANEVKRLATEAGTISKEHDARLAAVEQLVVQGSKAGALATRAGGPDHLHNVIHERFIGSQAFADFKERGVATGKIDMALSYKELTSSQGSGGSGAAWDVQPVRVHGAWGYGMREFTLLGAITARRMSTGNSTETHQLDGFVAAADTQEHEGALKAEQAIDPVLVRFPIETIAVYLPVSRQLLDDDESVAGSMAVIMSHSVLAKAERRAIYGTASNGQMRGFWMDAAVHTPIGGTLEDEIGDAAAYMADNGYAPDIVVVNPLDWRAIQARKATTDGHYLQGSPSQPIPPTLWGMRVVVSPAIHSGDVLLLDSRYATLLDRMSVTGFLGYEDQDNLRRNLATMLVEGRWGVQLLDRAAASKIVDFPTGSSS